MLTDAKIRGLKPRDKRYSTLDSDGLYIEVLPGGGKFWRVRKRYSGGEIKRSLGKFPEVKLRQARRLRDDAFDSLEYGGGNDTFEAVATEWLRLKVEPIRAPRHTETITSRLDRFILPAIATGRATSDPSGALRGALASAKPTHYATITDPAEIGALMRAVDGLTGSPIVRSALLVQAYTFVRPTIEDSSARVDYGALLFLEICHCYVEHCVRQFRVRHRSGASAPGSSRRSARPAPSFLPFQGPLP